ncbi:DHA1 family bicyclomycin/chloramphenicol resistance-like MFS transporter [Flavobacterium nitrogenifigens]|uniref:DHA1 family bicyclomycin/chloramphenicol resistance-like MFS transporter n=2 Tax=Flavobacterium TaxID=237 RepID=A0A7W7N8G7_9FLAO|nr:MULTISPECIES: multidrug effflux MFS transporter [Flavobacterium]MBB4803915.1 DHA1 family bicyclomycin/chloramphenicol resistance-like MFS transporter [Flavobacterium nitrogenifigens]MBB6388933.1 DHA1 family bicyclomycin/chloramphenicol resistance-like MFS transporter [Flavobacterium notoginsengisoli]
MTTKKYIKLILILGSLTALGPFSIDMYLPGFSGIAKDLNTSVAKVSMSLSSYFIGISAGQLLYGPLLDRFGRKKPLFIGLLVYILASLGCIYVADIDTFIFLRFVQAIGSCAATVASVAMVRDLFPVKDIPKVFSLLMLVVGLSPMLAPTIGGYVTEDLGWHAVFFILMCMGIVILMASQIGLPNTYKPDTSISLKPKPIINNFLLVLKEPQFYTYAFTGAIAFSGLFSYVAASPLVFMDIYKVDAKTYGWIFALMSVSFIGSSQLNSMLLKRFSSEQMIFGALISQSVISIIFLILALSDLLGLYETIGMLFLFLACLGISNPNTAGLTLAPFAKNTGSASALMGAIQLGLGALASFAIGVFVKDSVAPMVAIMTTTTITAFIILNIGKRFIKNKVNVSDADDVMIGH